MSSDLAKRIAQLKALSAKASDGAWLHYDKVFRRSFGKGRITEIQRYGDGKAIINWGGFDGLPPVTKKKKNHNARFIVELVNFFRKHADELERLSTPTDVADRREAIARIIVENCGGAMMLLPKQAEKAADAILSLIAGPLPEGYVAVPVEPTEAMIMKGVTVCCAAHNVADASRVWSAMLAARPTGES